MPNAAQNGAQEIQIENIISTIFLIPLGKWIVGIIGLIVLAIGIYQVHKGLSYDFGKLIKSYILTKTQIKIVKIVETVHCCIYECFRNNEQVYRDSNK